jgi:hypothetical protein
MIEADQCTVLRQRQVRIQYGIREKPKEIVDEEKA